MRNKLLFTATIICAGMTPFGPVCTRAQADDDTGAFDAYGISDGAVNAAYDAYGNMSSTDGSKTLAAVTQSITQNTAVVQNGKGLVLGERGTKSVQADTLIYNTSDMLADAQSRKGEMIDSLSSDSSDSTVDLGSNALQISYNPAGSVFAGCIYGAGTTCGAAEAKSTPTLAELAKAGWLYLGTTGYELPDSGASNQVPITETNYPQNVLTLTNPGNNYNGHTILRGRSALILAKGGGLTSQGMVEVGLGSNSAASLIVDGAGSELNLYDGGQFQGEGQSRTPGSLPNSLIGALVVGNNDPTLSLSYNATAPANLTNKLIVENGGTVKARTVSVANSSVAIGDDSQALGGVIYVTGQGSTLTAGDGGLTVNGGRGSIVVDRGGTITSNGAIALGDAQPAFALPTLQNTTQGNDYETVHGKLIIGQGGTLYAGDSLVTLQTNTGTSSNYRYAIQSPQTEKINGVAYPLVDAISENFNQAGQTTSIVTNNGASSFSILDGGVLANRNNVVGSQEYATYGSVAALHTNMDIGIGGTATFEATNTTRAAPDPLASTGTSTTGMVIGGNISDYTNSATGKTTPGSLQKTGTGTLALLGQNSYGGSTIVGSGTLQLGGVMGSNTVYGQRLISRSIAESSDAKAFRAKYTSSLINAEIAFIKEYNPTVSDSDIQTALLYYLSQPKPKVGYVAQYGARLSAVLAQSTTYQSALNNAYLNAGTLSSQSAVELAQGSTLNFAWGLEPSVVSSTNSQNFANSITGYGRIERALSDGNDADSASDKTASTNTLKNVTSLVNLTGAINLYGTQAADGDALLVHQGDLAIGSGTDSAGNTTTGSLKIHGNRDIVVGDTIGGTGGWASNNQLTVQDGGTVQSNGGLVVGQDSTGVGNVTVTDNGDLSKHSAITLAGNAIVGDAGTGTLSVGNSTNQTVEGGDFTAYGDLTIGNQTGSQGKVTVGNGIAGIADSSVLSHLNVGGDIAVGKDGVGYLSIQQNSVVSAYGVSVAGQNKGSATANSTLNVGALPTNDTAAADPTGASSITGGTLNIGPGGLTIGDGKENGPLYTAGVTRGGTINTAGAVHITTDGQLTLGADDASMETEKKGTLIVGDTGAGVSGYGIVNDYSNNSASAFANTPNFVMSGNGVIENRAGADLHIDSEIQLVDGKYGDDVRRATFNTNGQNTYAMKQLIGSGGLTKDGQGTLYLEAADNSYAGKTFVKEGTLAIAGGDANPQDPSADVRSSSNNTSSSGIEVNDGATLTGNTDDSGAAAATTVDAGGTVEANWNHYTGQLNIDKTLTMTDASSVLSVGANGQAFTPAASGDKQTEIKLTGQNLTGYDKSQGSNNGTQLFNSVYTRLNSGVINVNGSAALNNATLNIQISSSDLPTAANQGYRILNATSVTASQDSDHKAGYYNALTGNLTTMPFLSPYLVFEENAVDVIMQRNSRNFGDIGNTRNERETGHGLDGFKDGLIAHAMIGMPTAAAARNALNNLSGEIHASARSALIQDSYLLEQGMVDRMEDFGCDGDDRVSSHGRYDLHTHRKESRCYDDHAILWGQAYGSMGHNAGDGNASTLQHQTTGFIMGVDTPVDDRWRVGGMVAYGRSMFNSGGATNSSGNSNNISIGTYAGRHWGRLNLRLGGFYTWNLMSMSRRVQVGNIGGRQTSHYRNGTARVFGELGYKMNYKKVEFEPFAGLSYVNQYGGSFREHGVAALYSKGQDDGVLFSSFGFRAGRNFRLGRMWLRAHVMGAYRHAFGGIVSSRQQQLIGSTNDMSIGGVPLSRDSAIIKTGVSAKLSDRVDVDLSYIGQYGNQSIESGATGSVRFEF